MLNSQVVPSERGITCFPPKRLGVDLVNSLAAFVLSVWPGHARCRPLQWACQSTEPIFMSHVLHREFECTHFLSFIVHRGLNYHQEKFQQIMLCLYIPKINYLGSELQSLNWHQSLRTLLVMVFTKTPILQVSKKLVTQAFQIQRTVWRKD